MEPNATAPASLDEQSALLCPNCGYDLRAMTSDRCSECGLVVDRESLRVSTIPWAHRRRVGRVRAYLRTALGFILDRKSLRHEASRPQDPADGRAFARITAVFLALSLCAVLAFFVSQASWHDLTFRAETNPWGATILTPGWIVDLAVPWSAGAFLRPVLPMGLCLLAFHVTLAPRTVFRSAGPVESRRSAVALAGYVTAPLALLPLATIGIYFVLLTRESDHPFHHLHAFLLVISSALLLVAVLVTPVRTIQWLRRTKHCGVFVALLHLLELFALWLFGLILFLGVLPWCIGLFWLIVDSLR